VSAVQCTLLYYLLGLRVVAVFCLFSWSKSKPIATTSRSLDSMAIEVGNEAIKRLVMRLIMESNLYLARISSQRVLIDFSVLFGSSGASPRKYSAILLLRDFLFSLTTVKIESFEIIRTFLGTLTMGPGFNKKN